MKAVGRACLSNAKMCLLLGKEICQWIVRRDFARWHLSGCAKDSKTDIISVGFVGREIVVNDLAQMYFSGKVDISHEKNHFRWQTSRLLKTGPSADVMVRETFPLRRRAPAETVLHQTLVDSEVALERGFDDWHARSVSETILASEKRSRETGMVVHWAKDPRDLDYFYHELLKPSAEAQHGDRAHLPPLEFFRERWRPDCLLLLDDSGGQTIAGLFILKSRLSCWRLLRLGILPAVMKDSGRRRQVTVRLNFEAIKAACEDGQTRISFGISPAACNDGLWKFKTFWGAKPVLLGLSYPMCLLSAHTERGQRLLEERGVFVNGPGGLECYPRAHVPAETALSAQGERQDLAREAMSTATHLGAAAAATMILGLVLRLILPRMLGPEKLGVLYFTESISAMFFTFLPLGMATYIVREVPPDHSRAKLILPSIVRAQGVMAIVLMAAMMAFLALSGNNGPIMACAAAMGLYSGSLYFQRSILRRTYLALGQSALTARLEVSVRVCLVVLVLLALGFGGSVFAVTLCYAVSEILGVAWLMRRAKRDGLLDGGFNASLFREMILETLPFFAVGALVDIYGNLDVAMLRYISGNEEVAFYGTANKLKGVGLMLVPIMQAALQPALSKAWNNNRVDFEKLISSAMRLLVAVSLPMTLGLMAVPDLLSDLLFGHEFAASYRTISYLAPVLALTYLNVLMGSCMGIVSNGKKFLAVTSISIVINVMLNFVFILQGGSLWGAGGGAAGSSLATVVSEVFVLLSMRRIFRQGLDHWRLMTLLSLSLAPCLAMGLGFSWILTFNPWLRLGLVCVMAPLYVLMTGIVRIEDLRWFMRLKFGQDWRMFR